MRTPQSLLIPLITILFSSCVSETEESLVSIPKQAESGDEIGYSVATHSRFRADGSADIPDSFVMSAILHESTESFGSIGQIYIDHDVVKDISEGYGRSWRDVTATRYWPSDPAATLDFFIHAAGYDHADNITGSKDIMQWTDSFNDFSPSLKVWIDPEAGQQQELLYAALFNQKRNAEGKTPPIDVELKKAMTTVLFDARCADPGLDVCIYDIEFCGTAQGAYFRFPTSADDIATWDIPRHNDNRVDAHIDAKNRDESGEYSPLRLDSQIQGISYRGDIKNSDIIGEKSLRLIPGAYKRGTFTAGLWTNIYIKVRCTVGGTDPATGAQGPGWVYIPVDWGARDSDGISLMGRTLLYTLTFGKGNFGKTPDSRNLPGLLSCDCTLL